MDPDALHAAYQAQALSAIILDVWNPEPHIRPDTVQLADIATAHIAGHSYEGKLNGTLRCYHALCTYAGRQPNCEMSSLMPKNPLPTLNVDIDAHRSQEAMLHETIRQVYDILADDQALRLDLPEDEVLRATHFDSLRKNYQQRREFSTTTIRLNRPDESLEHLFSQLGFSIHLT